MLTSISVTLFTSNVVSMMGLNVLIRVDEYFAPKSDLNGF